MTTEPQGSPPPDEQRKAVAILPTPDAPRPVREVRVVTDPIPMLDTAKFEHMQRIATVMAESRLMPDSLRFATTVVEVEEDGRTVENAKLVELPMHGIIARCFMIVNQAVRWGLDPFAVAQCVGFVHGKLVYEGKLVHAVVEAKTGIRLRYVYDGQGKKRTVRVIGKFADEAEAREISGSVEQWHKGEKSPWAKEADWDRQLAYMGARVWARIHAPGVMLGIITDDEVEPGIGNRISAKAKVEAPELPEVEDETPTTASAPIEDMTATSTPKAMAEAAAVVAVNGSRQHFDPDKFLDSLENMIAGCDSMADLEHVKESNEEVIAALPEPHRTTAREMLDKASNGEDVR